MRFLFNDKDPVKVKDKIMEALGGRELGKMVQFELNGKTLDVIISKFGTSKLSFEHFAKGDTLEFNLQSEKIAFAHRAFQDDVKNKICKVIEQVGGKILET